MAWANETGAHLIRIARSRTAPRKPLYSLRSVPRARQVLGLAPLIDTIRRSARPRWRARDRDIHPAVDRCRRTQKQRDGREVSLTSFHLNLEGYGSCNHRVDGGGTQHRCLHLSCLHDQTDRPRAEDIWRSPHRRHPRCVARASRQIDHGHRHTPERRSDIRYSLHRSWRNKKC